MIHSKCRQQTKWRKYSSCLFWFLGASERLYRIYGIKSELDGEKEILVRVQAARGKTEIGKVDDLLIDGELGEAHVNGTLCD